MKMIFHYLEDRVANCTSNPTKKQDSYHALLYRAIISFLYTSGLRNSELRNLTLHDINLDNLSGAVIGKGNKYATITFSENARNHLVAYLKYRRQIFPNISFHYVFTPYSKVPNRMFTLQGLNTEVKAIVKSAGVKTKGNIHAFRHSLGTHLVQNGYNLAQIRDKLRHSSITVTNFYLSCNPDEQINMTKDIDTKILT